MADQESKRLPKNGIHEIRTMINEAFKACRELDSFNSYILSGYATKRIFSLDVASAILYVPRQY